MNKSRSSGLQRNLVKPSATHTEHGEGKTGAYQLIDYVQFHKETTPRTREQKKLFWVDPTSMKTFYDAPGSRPKDSKQNISILNKYKNAVYDKNYFFDQNTIEGFRGATNKLENSTQRSRVELPSLSMERMSTLGNESVVRDKSMLERSHPLPNKSILSSCKIEDLMSQLMPLNIVGGTSLVAEKFRKNIIRLNRECTSDAGKIKEPMTLKALGKKLYPIFFEILDFYSKNELLRSDTQRQTDASVYNSMTHLETFSSLLEPKRQQKENLQVKLESLEQSNNELHNELIQKQLLLADVAKQDRQRDLSETIIADLKSRIDVLIQSLADFKREKEETDSKARSHFNKMAKAIDKLTDQNAKLQEMVDHRDHEIRLLRTRITLLEKGDRAELMVKEKFTEQQLMLQEDIEGRKGQVIELRNYIHQLKQSIGSLVDNRKQSKSYYMKVNSTDNQKVDKLNSYLERFYELIKGNFFTYTISMSSDKDPVSGNNVHTFKEMISAQMSIPIHKLSSRTPLNFTALDRFLVDRLSFNRKTMEFVNCRKVAPNIFSLVRAELKDCKLENPDDLFGTKFNVLRVLEIIRGIFDSYYAELLALDDWRNARSFSQFVYLWFDYFDVDTLNKKIIRTYQEPEDCSVRRLEFLIQVSSPIFLKLWDSFFFIEGMCGNFNTDEVMYYLYLRYYLLHGQHAEVSGLSFEYRVLGNMDIMKRCLKTIDDQNNPMCEEIFSTISGLIPLTAKSTTEVDIHLVLRVFLEVYVCKKACKVKSLFDNMMNYKQQFFSQDRHLTFPLFKKVVQLHYEGMTASECLKFYSQVVSFAQGLNIDLKSFYIGGQDVCAFTLSSMFKAVFKIDYLKQVWATPDCFDGRFENKFINTKTNKRLLEKQIINHETLKGDSVEHLQKLAHDDYIQKMTEGIEEKTVQARQERLKDAESLGSMHLIDTYQKHLYLLNNPKRATTGGFIGNFSHSLQKMKMIERNIAAVGINIRMSKFASSGHEHLFIEGLLRDQDHFKEIQAEITKVRCNLDMWRSSKTRMLQKFTRVKLNSFYKMVIELIKINKSANNDDTV